MKEELLLYTCDNCKNTITVNANSYAGTPLHYDWIRLYKLIRPSDIQRTKLHFCSSKCAVAYLEDK